jgi:glycosyltransferase involved in cell wall biosynthesis
MNLSDKKMLIINLPPPYGGGEMLNQYLSDYFEEQADYIVIDIGKSKQKKNQQGKFTIQNIVYGLKSNLTIFYSIIKFRPSLVYFLIPKTFFPFLKTIPIISLCYSLGIYSIGSLEGNSFYFLDKKSSLKSKIGKSFLKKINIIRVLGNDIAKNMDYLQLKNTIVISNGVHVPLYLSKEREKKLEDKPIKFLFVGVLADFKGIIELIESFIDLLQITKNVELHLIGEWYSLELKKKMQGQILKNGVSKYFFFHGLQHGDEKWNIFKEMDIYIHLSHLDGQPLSILEAMGCGMPVISTKVGAIPETVVGDYNGYLLDKLDSPEIIKTIQKYINNYSLIKEHSANSIHLYNQFYTVSKFVERMEDLFTNAKK